LRYLTWCTSYPKEFEEKYALENILIVMYASAKAQAAEEDILLCEGPPEYHKNPSGNRIGLCWAAIFNN